VACFTVNHLFSLSLARARFGAVLCTFVHASVTSPDDYAIQSVKPIKAKTRCRGIRLDQPLIGRVERAAKAGGFSNPSAFIRAAIQRELAGTRKRGGSRGGANCLES
jgi:hypothetical protein